MDYATALDLLTARTSAYARLLATADPAAPVPTCPGWTVLDLADHLGRIHLWAAHAATHDAPADPFPSRDAGRPLAEWYADAAGSLLDALAGVAPDAPAWSFSRAHQHVGFWSRRQVHETAIHLLDLEIACGTMPPALVPRPAWLSADEATDGVGELLTVFLQRALDRDTHLDELTLVPAPAPVVVAVDGGPAWTVRLHEGTRTVSVTEGADPRAVARVSGDPVHLHLALWGRADRRSLVVGGDPDAAARFLAAALAA